MNNLPQPEGFDAWPDDLKAAYRAVWPGPFTFNENPLTRIAEKLKQLGEEEDHIFRDFMAKTPAWPRIREIRAQVKALWKLRRMITGTDL